MYAIQIKTLKPDPGMNKGLTLILVDHLFGNIEELAEKDQSEIYKNTLAIIKKIPPEIQLNHQELLYHKPDLNNAIKESDIEKHLIQQEVIYR